MSPETNQRVQRLFEEALRRPENERNVFLQEACSGDLPTYQAVMRLMDAQSRQQIPLTRAAVMQKIGRYQITGELGRGAMGVVYEGVDPMISRKVAIKVIRMESVASPTEATFLSERLFQEARSAGQLLHPGIVVIFDVGQEGDLAYIAMERVEGVSLQHAITHGRRLSFTEIVNILRITGSALDHAHTKGIIHRDVKPGNIIIDANGAAKLTDFGIAKIASSQYHTKTGMVMGTPAYMAPEQIDGRPLDGRADQYSLGVVAFELLTGNVPFQADSITAIAYAIVAAPRPSARAANPNLPAAVDGVLARVLHQSAAERFASCTQFADALEHALTGAPERIPTQATPVKKPSRQVTLPSVESAPAQQTGRRGIWFLAATLVVLLIAAAIGAYKFVPRKSVIPTPPPQPPVDTGKSGTPQKQSLPPDIAQFNSEPASIKQGASATLSWQVTGAKSVSLEPGGDVGDKARIEVKPAQTTVYTLVAKNEAGQTVQRTLRLEVEVPLQAGAIFAKGMEQRRAGHIADAIASFKQAAKLGDAKAMLELGAAAAEGQGLPQSTSEAMHWYRLAADGGNATAMLRLGGMYFAGEGGPEDPRLSAYWFAKGSDLGDAACKYNLGVQYENGSGVPYDMHKAEALYREAAALGNEEAKKRLQKMPPSR